MGTWLNFGWMGRAAPDTSITSPGSLTHCELISPTRSVFADTGLFEYGDARWVGTESGRVDYENWNVIDRHGYLRWRPIEADTPLRKLHWFWHPNDESSLKRVWTS